MEQTKPYENCFKCTYNDSIPGDAHKQCRYNWIKDGKKGLPMFSAHGIKKGWVMFPLNFDPIWMTHECEAFSKEREKEYYLGEQLAQEQLVTLKVWMEVLGLT